MKNNQQKRYETPRVEVIEIESQGCLCLSAGGPSPSAPGGKGFHFGTDNGSW